MAYTYYKEAKFSVTWNSGRIGIEVVSQSIEGNYSIVNLSFQVRKDIANSSYNSGGANMFLALNGTTKASSTSIDFRTYVIGTWYNQIQAGNVRVDHNPDGTGSISVRGYCATGVAGTYDQTQTLALPTIPRKSSISSLTPTVDVNGTNAVAVNISRADASFTHKVTFAIGIYNGVFTDVATSQSYALPLVWLNAIPNSISGITYCRVETFSGATSLGYVDGAFTITAPSTIVPTITDITFARDTTGTDPFTTYAKGISKVNFSGVSVTNQYSATTAAFKTYLHLASQPYTTGTLHTGSSFISSVLANAGTLRLTTIVTDSRGRDSVAYYEDFTVYDYNSPTLILTAFRCNATGVADPSGEYLSATMVVNVSPVNNNNTKTYILEYKKTTDSTWTSISTAALTGYSGTLNAVRAASSANTWEVRATVTDKVSTVNKATAVGTKRVPINSGFSGTAVAIGKVAETADLFEVDLPVKFNKAISIGSGSLLDFFYPVGTIYQTVSTALDTAAKMAAHFGGTWVAWGVGKVPVGVDTGQNEFDVLEETGGAKTHTLSTAEMPSHTHPVGSGNAAGGDFYRAYTAGGTVSGSQTYFIGLANATGGGGAHNNLQPYITCYFWKRTA